MKEPIDPALITKAADGDLSAIALLAVAYFGRCEYAQALLYAQRGAAEKDPDFLGILGALLYYGYGVRKDEGEGRKLLKESTESGSYIGSTYLADVYRRDKDVEKAQLLLKKGLAANYPDAFAVAGLCFDGGQERIGFLLKGIELGSAWAMLCLGNAYYNGGGVPKDPAKANEWYRKAADAGHPGAMFNLGLAYYDGEGVPKDPAKAAGWWERAADAGNAAAMFNLGNAYYKGDGVPKDPAKAAGWWERAADAGDPDAMFNLGLAYFDGEGVPKDPAKAAGWWERAADAGNADAMLNLGLAYDNGWGVPKDPTKANEWYRKAAYAGDPGAMFNLGNAYFDGEGVPKDPAKAAGWWERAADAGNAAAMFNLGNAYYKGDGVPKDPAKAAGWWERAADAGDPDAMLNLGCCFRDGVSAERDLRQARFWFKKALDHGETRCARALEEVEQILRDGQLKELPGGKPTEVFFSWNHFSGAKKNALVAEFEKEGYTCWDSDADCVGELTSACQFAISIAQCFIILLSPEAVASNYVQKEVKSIYDRVRSGEIDEKCIRPIVLDPAVKEKIEAQGKDSVFAPLLRLGSSFDQKAIVKDVQAVQQMIDHYKICAFRGLRHKATGTFDLLPAACMDSTEIGKSINLTAQMGDGYIPRTLYDPQGNPVMEESLLNHGRLALIRAEGGVGKTVYLNHLEHAHFTVADSDSFFFSSSCKALAAYLQEHLGQSDAFYHFVKDDLLPRSLSEYDKIRPLSDRYLTSLFKRGEEGKKVYFLLDSVDELGTTKGETWPLIQKAISEFIGKYDGDTRFLFSSRNPEFFSLPFSVEEFVLRSFTPAERKKAFFLLADRYAELSKPTESKDKKDNMALSPHLNPESAYPIFVDELNALSDDIKDNPLLLNNLIVLFLTSSEKLPKKSYDILSASAKLLFETVEKDRMPLISIDESLKADFALVLKDIRNILDYLAFKRPFYSPSRPSAEFFLDYFKSPASGFSQKDEQHLRGLAEKLERYLSDRSILVQGNLYHALFQSYFAAEHCYRMIYQSVPGDWGSYVAFKNETALHESKVHCFVQTGGLWEDGVACLLSRLDNEIHQCLPSAESFGEGNESYSTLKETLTELYARSPFANSASKEKLDALIQGKLLYCYAQFEALLPKE